MEWLELLVRLASLLYQDKLLIEQALFRLVEIMLAAVNCQVRTVEEDEAVETESDYDDD